MQKRIAWIATCIWLLACASSGASVSVGKTEHRGDIDITLLRLVEDSRCPDDPHVRCFWAGFIAFELELRHGEHRETAILAYSEGPNFDQQMERAGKSYRTRLSFAGHAVFIKGVSPAKSISAELKPEDYRVQLGIEKSL